MNITNKKQNTTKLSLPFNGEWFVFWGGDIKRQNIHHDAPNQRFAFDFGIVDGTGKTHKGDGKKNEDYYAFGKKILTPANGIIIDVIEGVRDNKPGSMNPYSAVGNAVVIKNNKQEISVLAHFKCGSIKVKVGDKVQGGQLIGLCGNSGNSSEPHLHYHLQDSPIIQEGKGIKCFFQKVVVREKGKKVLKFRHSPIKGEVISAWIQDLYLKIITKTYSNIENQEIQIFNDGWDYVVVVVNNELAFRFPRRKDYAKTLPIEVNFLKQFASNSPVRVPRLTYKKDEETGISYVTYDFIPGVQFTKSISNSFLKEELLTIAQQLGSFLTTVHSFPIEKAKQLGVQQIDSFNSWQKRLTKIKKEVFPNIGEHEQQWVVTLFGDFLETIAKTPIKSVLTHSDIMPEHIIVDPNTHTLSGIIDFGDILIADPAFDFTFLHRYGQDFLNESYKNYGLPRDEMFERRRQFYEDRLSVTNLEHSLELGDKERIAIHTKQLSEYVKSHPLIKRPVIQ